MFWPFCWLVVRCSVACRVAGFVVMRVIQCLLAWCLPDAACAETWRGLLTHGLFRRSVGRLFVFLLSRLVRLHRLVRVEAQQLVRRLQDVLLIRIPAPPHVSTGEYPSAHGARQHGVHGVAHAHHRNYTALYRILRDKMPV